MKALLVNPRMCSPKSVRLPLSVLALGAVLEGRYEYAIVDGNVDPDAADTVLGLLGSEPHAAVAITVMPGPQVAPAIAISRAIRSRHPQVPIIWGGYFPTLYPDAAINASYVDYVVRGQGEDTFIELLACLADTAHTEPTSSASACDQDAVQGIDGVTWKRDGTVVHNPDRAFRSPDVFPLLSYEKLGDVGRYLRPSFMGTRTAVHQAAIGCRFRCSFCGVVSMFNGVTRYPAAERLEQTLKSLRGYGANALQFYDHNFFDRPENTVPLLEVLAADPLPWWCYARADALVNASPRTWALIRASQLKMAYIGAEAASDAVLKSMRKGTRAEQTLDVARLCKDNGVIPEFSFVLGGPDDPEEEIERSFSFIKRLKSIHPECEIVLYFYTPTPQRVTAQPPTGAGSARIPVLPAAHGGAVTLPTTPEQWTEPQWIDFVCHRNAPWLTDATRKRVRDFETVLGCRFPTVQDYATPNWAKNMLRGLAYWRYQTNRFNNPLELSFLKQHIDLRVPQRDGL